jgi:hypothetical protein
MKRATNQVSLHRPNKWVCGPTSQTPTLDEVFMVTQAVFVHILLKRYFLTRQSLVSASLLLQTTATHLTT